MGEAGGRGPNHDRRFLRKLNRGPREIFQLRSRRTTMLYAVVTAVSMGFLAGSGMPLSAQRSPATAQMAAVRPRHRLLRARAPLLRRPAPGVLGCSPHRSDVFVCSCARSRRTRSRRQSRTR